MYDQMLSGNETDGTLKVFVDACVQLIVAERGPLVFVFNFSPFNDYEGYKVQVSISDQRSACIHRTAAAGDGNPYPGQASFCL
jgi:hypothetical protein